jgi:RNA polymerase sigma-70 factor (ECF subfamily)
MYRIARNAHIDHLRKRKSALSLDETVREPMAEGPGPEERAEKSQERDLIARALAELPPKKQEVLVLSRFQNLKYREIAELMDCPVGTVKALVHRAVEELGEIYTRLSARPAAAEECHEL